VFSEVCEERSSKWLSSNCVLSYGQVEADETVECNAHNTIPKADSSTPPNETDVWFALRVKKWWMKAARGNM
jgi:hypothetical protein